MPEAPEPTLRTLATLLTTTLLALTLAACDDNGSSSATPTPEPSPSPAVTATIEIPELTWSDCDDSDLQCATLAVPLDYDDPAARSIDIALARRPADDADARIGSLLVNPGGPGASGIDLAEQADIFFPEGLLERFDIVGFDPRGVGDSSAVDCGDRFDDFFGLDPTPDDESERQDLIDAAQEFVAECERRSGDVLPFVDTVSAARDLDLIRAALGEETISYLGFSYGTYLGATYADLFPDRVRALVLDGGVDPTLDWREQSVAQGAGFERALNAFFDECGSDEDCDFYSNGDPRGAFDELLAEIERAPLSATSAGIGRQLGPGEVMTGIAASLYDREYGWPALAIGLASARAGDGSVLLELYDIYTERNPDGTYGNLLEANAAVNCLDTPAPDDVTAYDELAAELEREAPRVGASGAYFGLLCAFWPAPAVGEPRALVAAGAPPIVVIGTTGDPATPYAWSQALASQLESGVLLTWEGEGHTATAKSDCIDDAIVDYLVNLTPPAEGTRCA
jgi:pimeloyl-ACP methyl ester carboxylesterase